MRLKRLTPKLMVEDVNRAPEFYEHSLGFELVMTIPEEGQFDWAMMECGSVEMMFQARTSLTEEVPVLRDREIGGALTSRIEMDDVKGLCAGLKDKAALVQELQTTSYGTEEFSIQDRSGLALAFAERI